MKESYSEGVAIHTGSESCARSRKGAGEALTGVRAGRVLSREITRSRVPTPWCSAEGNTERIASARCARTLRGRRPRARTETSCTGTGRSRTRLLSVDERGRMGKSKDAIL
jgi:RNA-directed DNA polymerase